MEGKEFIITDENVKEYVYNISTWIRESVQNAGAKGVVLGMSSGVDCCTVARLCQEANIYTHLVMMPYGDSMEKTQSFQHALKLINKFKFDYHIYNIKPAIDALEITQDSDLINESNHLNLKLAHANLRPRIRMTYLYEYARN